MGSAERSAASPGRAKKRNVVGHDVTQDPGGHGILQKCPFREMPANYWGSPSRYRFRVSMSLRR